MAKMTDDTLLKHLQSNEGCCAVCRGHRRGIVSRRCASITGSRILATNPLMDGLRSSRLRCRTRWNGYCLNCWTCSPPAMRGGGFEPSKADAVQGAQQATDACNYVFYKQNNGFLIALHRLGCADRAELRGRMAHSDRASARRAGGARRPAGRARDAGTGRLRNRGR